MLVEHLTVEKVEVDNLILYLSTLPQEQRQPKRDRIRKDCLFFLFLPLLVVSECFLVEVLIK